MVRTSGLKGVVTNLCKTLDPHSKPAGFVEISPHGKAIRAGGAGEETIVVCGAFIVHHADDPGLAAFPRIIHVRGEMGRAPNWLAGYVDVLSAEALEEGPGSAVVMARLSDALVARALRFHAEKTEKPAWLKGLADPHVARERW